MSTLYQAHDELFRRRPDECFSSVESLIQHCRNEHRESQDRWHLPARLQPVIVGGELSFAAGDDGDFLLNDWSFSQICRLSGVAKETVNRLSPDTARAVLRETLPNGAKPMQILTTGPSIRSIHGAAYSRLWNSELLETVAECAGEFSPPQTAMTGATGLYCGEQDLFAFLIDPAGWIEIGEEAFAPGFFVWNSEVGRRSLGISTFWFQKVCQNHIVWDATNVVEFTRKHTGNVRESLLEIRRMIQALQERRGERKDSFATAVRKAMATNVASDSDEAMKFLSQHSLPRDTIERAVKQLGHDGKPFTLWNLVDVLTHMNVNLRFAGDRTEADQKVAKLMQLAA